MKYQAVARPRTGMRWGWAYLVLAGAVLGATALFTRQDYLLHLPFADIWQHLAAINALAEDPLNPGNPFVASSEPSRLFGPLWVLVGIICHWFGLSPLQGFSLGGVANLALLGTGVWLLGTRLFGDARGAVALFFAMFGGWLFPPQFTGYHNILTLLCSAAYPAVTAIACALILWGLCLQWLSRGGGGLWIGIVTALSFTTHPLGTGVALAGSATIIMFGPPAAIATRLRLSALLAAGLGAAALWPYFNPWRVLLTASQPIWSVGVDFYHPYWILASLFPAILGLPYLLRAEMRPFLVLLLVATAGFALGSTDHFIAGHRLLSWMSLLLQIGLAGLLLHLFSRSSRLAIAGQALAIGCVVIQGIWTYNRLSVLRLSAEREGSLLAAARQLADGFDGGVAGDMAAAFPLTAAGTRVLATPFAEPLVRDMEARQRASSALFASQDPEARLRRARNLRVRYLVVDSHTATPNLMDELSSQAREERRSGRLIRYRLY